MFREGQWVESALCVRITINEVAQKRREGKRKWKKTSEGERRETGSREEEAGVEVEEKEGRGKREEGEREKGREGEQEAGWG